MRNKKLIIILTCILLITAIPIKNNFIKAEENQLTESNAIELLNESVKDIYIKNNYFPDYITDKNGHRINVNTTLIRDGINQFNANKDTMKAPQIYMVYGNKHALSNGVYSYLGYSREGDAYPNFEYPWDFGWDGVEIQNKNYKDQPWDVEKIRNKRNININNFDGINTQVTLSDGTTTDLEAAIQKGLDLTYTGKYGRDLMLTSASNYNIVKDKLVYGDIGSKPYNETGGRGKWIDYVHIVQPPTYYSWGFGMLILDNSKYSYLDVPIAPFSCLEASNDLSVTLENTPPFSFKDNEVNIEATIISSFKAQVNLIYTWDIRDSYGNQIIPTECSIDPVLVSGQGTEQTGRIDILEETTLKATFKMPARDVTVSIRVNTLAGDDPKEINIENNYAQETIICSPPLNNETEYILDYNVLSKKIAHLVQSGNDITAHLSLPKGSWNGNATGMLNVIKQNDPSGVLGGYQVTNNPAVNEASATIIRTPIVNATIKREVFGDLPGSYWKPNLIDLIKTPIVNYSGSVSRPYKYSCHHSGIDPYSHTVYRTASASFDNGNDALEVIVKVYNGKEPLPWVAARNFKKIVENNTYDSFEKNLFWVSKPYDYTVQRYMCHLDEGNNVLSWEARQGKYERTFTGQNIGEVNWSVKNSMSNMYLTDRTNAKNKKVGKAYYPRVPFASDNDLQKYNYPFKSGYYFNPTGEYTCKVKTVIFQNTTANTPEHGELINKVEDSFAYGSNMEYTSDGRTTYKINYTVANTDMVNVTEGATHKTVEEITYSSARNGNSHTLWKEILEGYSESNTMDSRDTYGYQEYVKAGKLYKITEETIVTIKVNPTNKKIYTYANMKDGSYYMKAWLKDFNYEGLSVKGLSKDNSPLDGINITVKGSMYDDLSN